MSDINTRDVVNAVKIKDLNKTYDIEDADAQDKLDNVYTKDESDGKYVTEISYNNVSKTIKQTKNGVVTDVVSVNVIKDDLDLTKDDVGLSNVVNTGDSATPTLNGTDKFTTGGAYVMQQDINSKVSNVAYDTTGKKFTKTIDGNISDVVSANQLKNDMDLNNVDNTSDLNKPISNATQIALDGKVDKTNGVTNVVYANKKFTKTINGTISDIVDIATIKSDLEFTKTDIGLENVTNDRQIKGLASGTTQGDILTFGSDGYSVQDSGKAFSNVVDENSTDAQVPTAKSVYDELVNVGAIFTVTDGTWDDYEN